MVGSGFDFAELGVGQAFGEVADEGGEGGFVGVGGLGGDGLGALEASGGFADFEGGLLAGRVGD